MHNPTHDRAVRTEDLAIRQRMARVMMDRLTLADACTRDDLRAAGFTDAQIDHNAEQARIIAIAETRAKGRPVPKARKGGAR